MGKMGPKNHETKKGNAKERAEWIIKKRIW